MGLFTDGISFMLLDLKRLFFDSNVLVVCLMIDEIFGRIIHPCPSTCPFDLQGGTVVGMWMLRVSRVSIVLLFLSSTVTCL